MSDIVWKATTEYRKHSYSQINFIDDGEDGKKAQMSVCYSSQTSNLYPTNVVS